MGSVFTVLYLDNAATSYRKPAAVYASMLKNTVINSANAGRGGHYYSIRTAKGIYETSESLCRLFNIPSPERIAYTPNATYALNMGILGALSENSHAVITQMEHNSVLRPVYKTCKYTMVKASNKGEIDPGEVEKAIKPNTSMIIMTHASNVCGTILPIKECARIAHRHGLIFMVDAAQSAGCLPIDVERDGIDLMAFSGHKGLMTPLGVGGLYVREGISLKPIITGGTGSMSESLEQPDFMPDLLQSGTVNAPAIIAAKKSIDLIIKETPKGIGESEKRLAEYAAEKLKNIGGLAVYGLEKGNRNGTVAFNVKGIDSIRTAEILNDDFHICTRGGWHCAYPSHEALGTEKTGAVRASFGYYNTIKDADRLVDAVFKISK